MTRKRPDIQKRYELYLGALDSRTIIELLSRAYEDTGHEGVWKALQIFESRFREVMLNEEGYRAEELDAFFRNPGLYPHAVVTWFMAYRDKETQ